MTFSLVARPAFRASMAARCRTPRHAAQESSRSRAVRSTTGASRAQGTV